MKTIPVSVIIPCYCNSKTIGRAVASVFAQTMCPSEVIIIDDASPDETYSVLQQLQDFYGSDWLRIIRLTINSGPSRARNTGWDISQYPYIAFLDADDSWHGEKLEIQYTWMSSRPEVVLTGHQCCILSAEQDSAIQLNEYKVAKIGKYKQLFSNQFSTPSVMLKRDIHFRFPISHRYAEDFMLWCEIIAHGFPAYKFNGTLAYMYKPRYGDSGLSANLWQMELGELGSYSKLYAQDLIPLFACGALMSCSFLKYIKRVFLTRYLYRNTK